MSTESVNAAADGGAAPSVEDAAIARIVTRLSSEYVLRAFQLLIELYGDVRVGLVAQAINTANIAHLDARTEPGQPAADPDGILPDELRRPISIGRLAASAGVPFESARRIVQRLVDEGRCVRVEGGVIVPRAAVQRPENTRAVLANAAYVRRFMRELQIVGLATDGAFFGAQAIAQDGPVVRLVGRLSAGYLLRALGLLVDTYGDIRLGVVAQTIVAANTAYLDTRLNEAWRHAGVEDAPADEIRRPISVARLAASLALPYETIRGQTQRLLAAGLCARVDGGLIVPARVLASPAAVRSMLVNVGYVRKLVRDMEAVGPAAADASGAGRGGAVWTPGK